MKFKPLKRPKIRMRRPRIRIRWRKKTSRRVIVAAVLFFVALFSLQLVLLNYTKSILQNALNLQLQEATNGRYVSSFGNIDVSYTQNKLTIHNLRLFPKEQAATHTIESPLVYEVFVPEVEINGLNLRKAYLQGQLDIGSLELQQPQLQLYANFDRATSNGSFSLFNNDLYNSLPEAISQLEIDAIRLLDGSLQLNIRRNQKQSNLHLSHFNLELNQFQLKETLANKAGRVFFSDNFVFEADSLEGLLADSLYSFELQTLKLSSRDSSAFAESIKLKPLKEADELAKSTELANLYTVEFPQLYLYGLSIEDLFRSGNFISGEITILSPDFKLLKLQPLSPGKQENIEPKKLFSAIENVLNSIQVQELYLRNGRLQISEYDQGLRQKMLTNIQLAQIENFVLDSVAHLQKDKLLYADDIILQLQNYSLRLSDELHLLQADELSLSSEEESIRASGFRILPDTGSKRMAEDIPKYYASAPGILLDGVDMLKAYHHNRLSIDSLLLQQPSFSLTPQNKTPDLIKEEPAKERFHEEDLYGLVKDYLYSLTIERISMQEGQVNIKQPGSPASDAFLLNISQADLWDFRLDSASAYQLNKLFYANDFELEIENYQHDLPDNIHTVSAGRVAISTLTDQIHLKDIYIKPAGLDFPYTSLPAVEAKTLLNLHVPELSLFGADILKAYLYKQLEVEKVLIPFPVLQLGTIVNQESDRPNIIKSSALYDLIKDRLEVIKVEDLELQEANINLAFYDSEDEPLKILGQQVSVQMSSFLFDSATAKKPQHLFYSEEFEVQVKDYETHFSDGIHVLRAENLLATSLKKEITVENVTITTKQESYTDEELLVSFGKSDFIKMELPRLHLSGIDFHEAYRIGALKIDSVLAVEPTVLYTYLPQPSIENTKSNNKLRESGIYKDIAPYLQALFINAVLMKDGSFFALQQQDNLVQDHIAIEDISLLLHHFQLDSSAIHDTAPFLYSANLWLNIGQYQQQLLKQQHILSAENISISTQKNAVEAQSISIKPVPAPGLAENKLLPPVNEQYYLELPRLQVEGIRFDSLFKYERLYTKSLLLHEPKIRLRHHTKPEGESADSTAEFDLKALLPASLQSLFVEEAKVLNGQLTFSNDEKLRLKIDRFNVLVQNFYLQDSLELNHPPFHAEDIQLSVVDFERTLADSLHLLTIEEINFSTAEELLSIKELELKPRILPEIRKEMALQKTSKLYNIKIPLTQLYGIDPQQLKSDSLLLNYILITKPEVEIMDFPALQQQKPASLAKENIWQQEVLKSFQLLYADSAAIEDASFTYTTIKQEEKSSLRVNHINAFASNLLFDSLAAQRQNRLLLADYLALRIEDYTTTLDDELYRLSVNEINWNSKNKDLVVDSVSLFPLTDRETFAEIKGYETDQFTIRNKKLELQNFQLDLLINEGKFRADSLLLDNFYLLVYRDKHQPYPENHFPQMPQTSIRKLDVPFFVSGVAIRNGYIGYAELAKGARESGFIDLTDVLILGDTITNFPQLLNKGVTTNLYLNAQLMGKGNLSAFFEIPLNDTLNQHTFYGRLDKMELAEFNPILEKTVSVKIKSGYTEQIDFYVVADRNKATGSMEFIYNDLQVALVNKKTGNTGGPVKQLASLVANAFFVDSENMAAEDDPLRRGKIEFERDETRSTVNYWIKTLVNGFKSSIGL